MIFRGNSEGQEYSMDGGKSWIPTDWQSYEDKLKARGYYTSEQRTAYSLGLAS